MKMCPHCDSEKELVEFNNDSSRKDGKASWCRSCQNAHSNIYYDKHRERRMEYARTYRKENLPLLEERRGDRMDGWESILADLFGTPLCQICGGVLSWFKCRADGRAYVCWDHKNGKTSNMHSPSHWLMAHVPTDKNKKRFLKEGLGILCFSCNCGLPTDPELRKKTAEYLNG